MKQTFGPDAIEAAAHAEGDALRNGDQRAALSSSTSGEESAPAGTTGAAAPVVAGDFLILGQVATITVDMLCVRACGPGSEVAEPLRTEAVKAWAAVAQEYLPQLQQAGPLGALAGIYLAHALLIYSKAGWIPAPSPASSENGDRGKPLSSDLSPSPIAG